MSALLQAVNQLLQGFVDLGEGIDDDTFMDRLRDFVSNLPREVQAEDGTQYDDSTQESSLEERVALVEDILSKYPKEMNLPGVDEYLEKDTHVEPYEIEYGKFEDGPIDGDYDHIDVFPCGIDRTKNDLGQIAIGVVSNGEDRRLTLADDAVVMFLRLERPVERDNTTIYGIMLGGVPDAHIFPARIDQEDSGGGGEYNQWAEVESDTTSGVVKTKTDGRTHTSTGLSLWESNQVTKIPTGSIVLVHVEPGDNLLYLFEYGGNSEGEAPDALKTSLIYDKWYDIQGDEAWFTVDTRDWSNRFVEVGAVWDGGAPVDNGTWSEDNGGIGGSNVQHKESLGGVWKDQEEWKWFRLYLLGGGVAQEITKIDTDVGGASTTVATWRMATDGTLEMQVTEYNTRISMRITIRAFAKNDAADAIVVT